MTYFTHVFHAQRDGFKPLPYHKFVALRNSVGGV